MDRYIEDSSSGNVKKTSPPTNTKNSNMASHEVELESSTAREFVQDSGADEDMRAFITELIGRQTAEICAKIDGITARVVDLEKSVEFNSERINTCETKTALIDDMAKELENMKRKVLLSEIYSRKANILIYGMPDSTEDLTDAAKDIFVRILQIDSETVRNMKFVNIHRLPAQHKKIQSPDPVIIKFVCQQDRDLVMQTRFKFLKDLTKEKLVFRTDLPPELKQRRAKLEAKAYPLRKEHRYQTRVLERGTSVSLQYRKSTQMAWKTLDLNETPVFD